MFEINGTLVIFVASFLVFMVLLNQIMLQPVGKAIAKRQEKIQNDLDAARAARQQATELVDGYETRLKNIRSEAHGVITSAVAAASKDKTSALEKVRNEGLANLESAKARIAAERESLIDGLVAHERELVEEITQKILGEPVAVQLDASKVRKNLEET
jgi:F-type H+-transporting ATPase subunit b